MSWYGRHPQYSKNQIKSLLPPSACKQCVYWFRTVIGSSPESWHQDHVNCSRCGLPQWEILAKLNEELLGIRRPAKPDASDLVLRGEASEQKTQRSPISDATTAVDKWIALYRSANHDVIDRAARQLIHRRDAPLWVLLDILDNHSLCGLGSATQKALNKRRDPELVAEMRARLTSNGYFTREVACSVLGEIGDRSVTPLLLQMLDDPHWMVRRAAAYALVQLKDPASIPELTRRLSSCDRDDSDVAWALEAALQSLDVEFGAWPR